MSLFRNKYFTVCDNLLEWDTYLSECANCLLILMTRFPPQFSSVQSPAYVTFTCKQVNVIFVGVSLVNLHCNTIQI